jgi:hypothetical protein
VAYVKRVRALRTEGTEGFANFDLGLGKAVVVFLSSQKDYEPGRDPQTDLPGQTHSFAFSHPLLSILTQHRIRHWYSRRSLIEPVTGHCKSDNRLDRNHLKGTDKMNAILSACGFNIRKLLRKILFWLLRIVHKLRLLQENSLLPQAG